MEFGCDNLEENVNRDDADESINMKNIKENALNCDECGRKHNKKINVERHIGKSAEDRFKCEQSNNGFSTKEELNNHNNRYHERCEVGAGQMEVITHKVITCKEFIREGLKKHLKRWTFSKKGGGLTPQSNLEKVHILDVFWNPSLTNDVIVNGRI